MHNVDFIINELFGFLLIFPDSLKSMIKDKLNLVTINMENEDNDVISSNKKVLMKAFSIILPFFISGLIISFFIIDRKK